MNYFSVLIFLMAVIPVTTFAQTTAPAVGSKISKPFFLKAGDKTPSVHLTAPAVPQADMDGNPLDENEAIDAPPADILAQLSGPDLFETIKTDNQKEIQYKVVYWHSADDLDYGHVRDGEGNNWYGWSDGLEFHWILRTGNRYWWRDNFAGHWLYYGGGHWWWADLQDVSQIQVLIEGEYYLCLPDGTIVKDMGQDGNGDIVSAPGRYQGDSPHGGGHGGHGGHGGGHGDGQGSQGVNSSNSASGDTGSSAGQ